MIILSTFFVRVLCLVQTVHKKVYFGPKSEMEKPSSKTYIFVSRFGGNEIFEIFHYLLSTTYWVLGTSSRYTTKKPLILLQIQPKPHFKIHKDVIRLLIVSRPPSDNFNDRDTSIRTSRKTENQKYGLFILFTGFRPQKDVNKRKNL